MAICIPGREITPLNDGEFEEFVDRPPSTTKLKHTSTAGGLRQDRHVDGDEPGTPAASVTNYYSGKRVRRRKMIRSFFDNGDAVDVDYVDYH
jgi:hypothetical protein